MSFDPRLESDPVTLAEAGWMPGVEYVPTVRIAPDSYGVAAGNMWPRAIVHHVMQGFFTGARAMMSETTYKPPSWHFSIARDGRIMQHASIWDTTMHAGLVSTDVTTDPAVNALRDDPGLWLQPWQARNPNTWAIGVEHEGFSIPAFDQASGHRTDDFLYGPDHPWPEPLIASSIRVQRWCWSRCQWLVDLPSGEAVGRFLTHAQIDPRLRPQDPGTVWDTTVWDRIVNGVLVKEAAPRPIPIEPPPMAPTEPIPAAPDLVAVRSHLDTIETAVAAIRGTLGGS